MKTISLVFLAGLQLFCVSSSTYETLEKEHTQANARLAGVSTDLENRNREYAELESRLKAAESDRDNLKKDLAAARDSLKAESEKLGAERKEKEALNARLDASQKSEAGLKDRITVLEQSVQKLQTEKAAADKSIAELKAQIAGVKPSRTIDEAYAELVSSLRTEVERGDIKIENVNNQLRLSVAERVFFSSGSAVVSSDGKEVLRKLAQSLRNLKNKDIFVEGHTDSVAIGAALLHRFPTNWELGSARAVNVVRFLSEQNGLEAARLSAVSHGPNRPVADNATEEGRARNRRIEITILESTPFNASQPPARPPQDAPR